MHSSKIAFIANESLRLIQVSYEPMDSNLSSATTTAGSKLYNFKTLDQSIKPGDFVVVETNTRHGLNICKVEKVDLDVDFDDHMEIKWAFTAIDMDSIQKVKAAEQEAIDKVRQLELRRKRAALREAMFADQGAELGKLAIASPSIIPGE